MTGVERNRIPIRSMILGFLFLVCSVSPISARESDFGALVDSVFTSEENPNTDVVYLFNKTNDSILIDSISIEANDEKIERARITFSQINIDSYMESHVIEYDKSKSQSKTLSPIRIRPGDRSRWLMMRIDRICYACADSVHDSGKVVRIALRVGFHAKGHGSMSLLIIREFDPSSVSIHNPNPKRLRYATGRAYDLSGRRIWAMGEKKFRPSFSRPPLK